MLLLRQNMRRRPADGGDGQDWKSFPQYFKENGYTTLGTGKTVRRQIFLPRQHSDPRTPGTAAHTRYIAHTHLSVAISIAVSPEPAAQLGPAAELEQQRSRL